MKALLDQQIQSKEKLQQMYVGAFFMEAGTGKTRPCVELVNEIEPDYVLYFAPYQCINTENEKESTLFEINKWGGFNCNFDLIGIESIQNSDRIYLEIHNKIINAKKAVIIVDESLKIKNADAKRTQRILLLSNLVKYKYILNGTPLSRNLLDLWSQMEFLSPTILNMNETQFKNNFCEHKKVTIRKGNRSRSKEWIVKYHNLDYLYKLIEPYVFRANLQLDVNLQEIEINFNLSEEENKEHKRVIEEVLTNEWLMAKPNFFLSLTQKLQNNYSLNAEKITLTKAILKREPKTLIVAKYIATQNKLKELFPHARILSWQKHAQGLNLQDYKEMLLFDQHWDYGLFDQIQKRIYRTGQKHDCVIRRFKGNCGLENLMWNNVNAKQDLLQEFKKMTLETFKKEAV